MLYHSCLTEIRIRYHTILTTLLIKNLYLGLNSYPCPLRIHHLHIVDLSEQPLMQPLSRAPCHRHSSRIHKISIPLIFQLSWPQGRRLCCPLLKSLQQSPKPRALSRIIPQTTSHYFAKVLVRVAKSQPARVWQVSVVLVDVGPICAMACSVRSPKPSRRRSVWRSGERHETVQHHADLPDVGFFRVVSGYLGVFMGGFAANKCPFAGELFLCLLARFPKGNRKVGRRKK